MVILALGQLTKEEKELNDVYLAKCKKKLSKYADAVALAGYVNGWDDGSDGTVQGSYSQEGYISMPVLRTHINENEEVKKAYNEFIESFADYAARLKTIEFIGGMDAGYDMGYSVGSGEYGDALTDSVFDMGLSSRSRDALLDSGFKNVKDIMNLTFKDFLKIPRLGKISVQEIVDILHNKYGIEVKRR